MTEPRPTPRPIKFDPASLKFNDHGLIPAIAQAHGSGEVLIFGEDNILASFESNPPDFLLMSTRTGRSSVPGFSVATTQEKSARGSRPSNTVSNHSSAHRRRKTIALAYCYSSATITIVHDKRVRRPTSCQ